MTECFSVSLFIHSIVVPTTTITTCGLKPDCLFPDKLVNVDCIVIGSVNAEPGAME